ncbi:uncharacterized protein LOC111403897 [Olea europaea var. sylvestris]|uniref:ATP-dependent Clp protease ATP-binding subunit clpX n=1 Tax=Olea europaea subsp. europaea TaxID=158383 RepID=A0A8S0UUF4_OLEEU|nr:uncharacterized protein LOC111403897 [Olea europaea var. sylvestris]CAA3024378.1 ATP-dependent Clp protease ATP-binding subunit clpX [Olea europaea subsp. europaea]
MIRFSFMDTIRGGHTIHGAHKTLHFHFLAMNSSKIFSQTHFLSSKLMGYQIQCLNPQLSCRIPNIQPNLRTRRISLFSSYKNVNAEKKQQPSSTSTLTEAKVTESDTYSVKFETLGGCKLGISRYPDFEYDAAGGTGTGTGTKTMNDAISVEFDIKTLYIPPLSTATTKFLGMRLPPFLRIDIVPELFQGSINQESGQVDLKFKAKFWFSIGSIYKAPPLTVQTVLTSEESNGKIKRGRGEKLNKEGRCSLVGVATVEPINDFFMDSFLSLPTECLANLNATISFSSATLV